MCVKGSDHAWEDEQHGGKDIAHGHEVSSPSMLYPSCVHSQGKEICYL